GRCGRAASAQGPLRKAPGWASCVRWRRASLPRRGRQSRGLRPPARPLSQRPLALLGNQQQGARVVVEEISAPDRRQLAVAEESRQRKLAERLADCDHVVIGLAVEPAASTGAIEIAAREGPASVEARGERRERRLEILPRGLRIAELELDRLPHA